MARRPAHQWNVRDAARSTGQTASALSVSLYRLSADALLALENEGFDTEDWSMRMDVIEEFAIFGLHLMDRFARDRLDEESRTHLLQATAQHLAGIVGENRTVASGPGDHERNFVDLVNERCACYAALSWSEEEGPGFTLRKELGDAIAAKMVENNRQWICMYVIDREAPRFVQALGRNLRGLLPAS